MRVLMIICVVLTAAALVLLFGGCNGPNTTYPKTSAPEDEPDLTDPTQDQPQPQTQTQTPRLQSVKVAPRRADAGHLSVDKRSIDLGVVEPSTNFSRTFTLTNDGNEDLTINNMTTSCSCSVSKLKIPTTLKPGQSIPLDISFNSGATPRMRHERVTVFTKPPAQPKELSVAVTAQVKKLVRALPEQLEFEMRSEAPEEYEIIVESTDERSFTIGGYTCSGNALQLTYDKKAKATRHTLTISKIDFEKLRLVTFGYLNIKVTHPKISDIAVLFRVIPPFSAFPPNGRFHNLVPGQSQTTAIRVVSNFREDFKLGEIRTKNGLVKVKSTTKTTDGYKILVEMNVPKNTKKVIFQDQLTIEILDRPQESLTVSCYGYVKPTKSPGI